MILVWDEIGQHVPSEIHPGGIRSSIASGLENVQLCHLDEPNAGLSDDLLDQTQTLIWWGHARHHEVPRDRAEAVLERLHKGKLGLILVHSAHQSLLAQLIFGNPVFSKGGYDHDPQREEVKVCAPWHPICEGVQDFVIEDEEMYGAPANFPPPETVLLQSYFPRHQRSYPSGLTWTVGEGKREIARSGPGGGVGEGEGAGRVAYLRFGHETSRSLFHPPVQRLMANAAKWVSHQT